MQFSIATSLVLSLLLLGRIGYVLDQILEELRRIRRDAGEKMT